MTIQLVSLDRDMVGRLALGAPPDGLGPVEVMPILLQVGAAHDALYEQTGATEPWIGYLALEQGGAGRVVVGSCGFKDQPRDGVVEIAYLTFPEHEGRGIGRHMAAAVLDIAEAHRGVTEVRAHTLPEANASTRILERLGFHLVGAVQDPDDGEVWRWSRAAAGTGRDG